MYDFPFKLVRNFKEPDANRGRVSENIAVPMVKKSLPDTEGQNNDRSDCEFLRIKSEMGAEFEAVFAELASKVRANESGNVTYQLCRSRSEATTYKVLEIYHADEALEVHRASDHFRFAGPALGAFLEGRPEVELLDAIG